jgi:hypothetical protein
MLRPKKVIFLLVASPYPWGPWHYMKLISAFEQETSVLNSSGTADLDIFFFIISPLTTHLKMVFPNVASIVPSSHP